MAYTQDFGISLGSSRAGLTLNGQLVDQAAADVGSAIAAGFSEIGAGNYLLDASIPDDHRGGIKVYEEGDPSTVLAFGAINPESAQAIVTVTADLAALTAAVAAIAAVLARMHGLLGKEYGMRNAVYDGHNLTSFDICLYDSAVHAALNDGATGLLYRYAIANTYNGAGRITESVTTEEV